MAEFFTELTDKQREFVARQPVFFVATSAADARINLSPKGMDCFRILSPTQVAYLDVGGSGNETQAHLNADGRITIMMCAFDRPALIFRMYGRGRSVLPQDEGFEELLSHFTILPGTRQIFVIDIDSIQESCGWGVPYMSFDRERETLRKYHAQQDPEERLAKVQGRTKSIDGLPTRPQARMIAADGS